jgi:TDG/mug DNA glycosylase family protein
LPIIADDAAVLILGSFPSAQSLLSGQYYANPRNAFWKILGKLTGIDPGLPYEERVRLLMARHIALWDTVGSCRRSGSADGRIEEAVVNDIPGLIESHAGIRLVACNGSASARFLRGLDMPVTVSIVRLPSTSPANARVSFSGKCKAWSVLQQYL